MEAIDAPSIYKLVQELTEENTSSSHDLFIDV